MCACVSLSLPISLSSVHLLRPWGLYHQLLVYPPHLTFAHYLYYHMYMSEYLVYIYNTYAYLVYIYDTYANIYVCTYMHTEYMHT